MQHSAHFASIQPSVVIVKKVDYSPINLGNANINIDGGIDLHVPGVLEERATTGIDDPDNLVFDASFG